LRHFRKAQQSTESTEKQTGKYGKKSKSTEISETSEIAWNDQDDPKLLKWPEIAPKHLETTKATRASTPIIEKTK
jgi:hypothetical protein